ncbi:MAG: SpoIVB peptidase [Clostridia bacterium]|nr:SpoIVB peptidase [Clostridia bacterium]
MKKQSVKIFTCAVLAAAVARLFVVSAAEQVSSVENKTVVLGGQVIGVKLYTKGIHVLKLSDVETTDGKKEPAKKAGLKVGDYITHVDGKYITAYEQFADCLQGKTEVMLSVSRGKESLNIRLEPAVGKDGIYRAGIWVRDSIAGLGTVTCFDPATNHAVALGHGITDTETGLMLIPARGRAYKAYVTSVDKGKNGKAGALNGSFADENGYLGEMLSNSKTGAYFEFLRFEGLEIPVATHQEVQEGEAVIYSTVSGDEVKPYTVNIKKVIKSSLYTTKGMILEVTDPSLLKQTGGIVCGMSGSPLVQNGKLIGAVTHVFVNDPTKGYGIFIENMLTEAEKNK